MDDSELAAWRETVTHEIALWQKDPSYVPSLPPCPAPSDLVREQRLLMLEERITGLEKVLDQNTAVFRDSLQFAELCIQALQRALDDMVAGALKTLELEPETTTETFETGKDGQLWRKTLTLPARKAVDFKAYLNAALQQRLRTKTDAKLAPVAEQTVFEFGG